MMIPFTPSVYLDLWLFKLPIHGIFALIGIVLGMLIMLGNARKQKISPAIILAGAFWVFVGAWTLSKLFFYLGPYDACFSMGIWDTIRTGFVFYGGLIGGILAGYIYTRIKHYNFWRHADLWAFGIPLGVFIARLGCFLVNDAPGRITDVVWAVKLPDGTIRHPAALYLSLLNLLIFAYIYSAKYSRRFQGQLFLKYLMLYSAGRFFIEFLREYPFYYLGLTFSQWISIALFIISLIIYFIKSRQV